MAVFHNPNDTRHDDTNVRAAVRLAVVVAALSVGFLVTAALWVSTCNGATADTAACGVPQRTMLAIGAPVILLIGGLRALCPHLSGVAGPRGVVGVAGGGLVSVHIDVARADHEHARLGRARRVRRVTCTVTIRRRFLPQRRRVVLPLKSAHVWRA